MKCKSCLLVALFAAAMLTAACKTIEGAGEDISSLGKGISETSQKVQNGD